MRVYLDKICSQQNLEISEVEELFGALVRGELEPVEIAALLIGLRAKGEHPDEIAGAARALRSSATPFARPTYPFVDSCGTGGDGAHTINVSTAAALVTAEMGIPVAKHGNRSVSSKCGSADVLERLGVRLEASPEVSRKCLDEVGICFLFAPSYHPGLRHAGPVRRQLAVRTVMNILGPLVNPAAPTCQVVGVYDPSLCRPLAQVLGTLGCKTALVVHGKGLDEIAIHGTTVAAMLSGGEVTEIELSPDHAGLPLYDKDQIRGGSAQENAVALTRILEGRGVAAHNAAVALNAGALAWISGIAESFKAGVKKAQESIESGRCISRLKAFAEMSHGA